ncbi:hypothetical protein HPB49_003648 [Dermacentor silvarum]|uniref:Uncharacterized protein n=1 Tax=Dermacentor silvarum TaxID=543639 RepID=A0ACB8C749_DERSI|nr:hypothetical protein HPB49_003648 [Dermacentor silvarum]
MRGARDNERSEVIGRANHVWCSGTEHRLRVCACAEDFLNVLDKWRPDLIWRTKNRLVPVAQPLLETFFDRPRTIKGAPVPLPKFSGYQDRHSPQDFLEKYSGYCIIEGIPSDRRLQLLPAALQGSAKQWWRFSGGHPDWQSFTSEFMAEFTAVDYKFKLEAELDRHTRHPAENLKQFIHVIAEYYDHIAEPVSDAKKVECVQRQMHPTFQDLTASMSFANLLEMAKAAGPIVEGPWHRLRYVPPPPMRNAQAAADLAFVYSSPHTQLQRPTKPSRPSNESGSWSLQQFRLLSVRGERRFVLQPRSGTPNLCHTLARRTHGAATLRHRNNSGERLRTLGFKRRSVSRDSSCQTAVSRVGNVAVLATLHVNALLLDHAAKPAVKQIAWEMDERSHFSGPRLHDVPASARNSWKQRTTA